MEDDRGVASLRAQMRIQQAEAEKLASFVRAAFVKGERGLEIADQTAAMRALNLAKDYEI